MSSAGRVLISVTLGTLSAVVELLFVLVALPLAGRAGATYRVSPSASPEGETVGEPSSAGEGISSIARRLAALELKRLGVPVTGYTGRQAMRYLALRWPVGLLGGMVLVLLGTGVTVAIQLAWSWVRGEAFDDIPPTPLILIYTFVVGTVLLFLDICGLVGVQAVERHLALRHLGPTSTEALERRIAELAETRAGILAAVDSERRRIERDLHDGLQQRLVALSMVIGRARRGRPELLGQAHEEAQRALAELREVAWRVYPSGLDTLGLGEALAGVAERSSVPVTLCCSLARRPPMAVETAAYFVVCEAVTNAAKHSDATRITVEVTSEDDMLTVRIEDDGIGGANPEGGGLSGLARRVAALDGRFTVLSPLGGPTTITAELPCG
ncbi:sensor histidine kinase [Streptosporangium sp. NPDC000396]|uniref:sensor histidine kinase n=1 Tax=Streptosporangium sp. NPDC000396 TaxID=3366185 RepID=UPI0036B56845